MSDQQSNINLNELNQALSQNVIHYEFKRVDYTINESELSQLEEIGNNLWNEIFFATLGIAIPTLLNGYISQNKLTKDQSWTNEIFTNYLFGGICISLAIISLIIWQSNRRKKTNIIDKIKSKPQFILPQQ